jgi:glutamyl-tRNA synthetase
MYRAHLRKLAAAGMAYPCTCTRKDIEQASSAPHGDEGAIYPGTCRGRWKSFDQAQRESGDTPAWRFLFEGEWSFHDEVQGDASIDASTLGDFVLWRRDDLPSYQLAVTVDDAAQGVTQVLRGRDLVSSTARQLALYRALGLAAPDQWAHVPLIQDQQGRRMAKRDGAMALAHLRDVGVDPRRVVGLLAWSAGLIPEPKAATPAELLADFDITLIKQDDFVITGKHLKWLAEPAA